MLRTNKKFRIVDRRYVAVINRKGEFTGGKVPSSIMLDFYHRQHKVVVFETYTDARNYYINMVAMFLWYWVMFLIGLASAIFLSIKVDMLIILVTPVLVWLMSDAILAFPGGKVRDSEGNILFIKQGCIRTKDGVFLAFSD